MCSFTDYIYVHVEWVTNTHQVIYWYCDISVLISEGCPSVLISEGCLSVLISDGCLSVLMTKWLSWHWLYMYFTFGVKIVQQHFCWRLLHAFIQCTLEKSWNNCLLSEDTVPTCLQNWLCTFIYKMALPWTFSTYSWTKCHFYWQSPLSCPHSCIKWCWNKCQVS